MRTPTPSLPILQGSNRHQLILILQHSVPPLQGPGTVACTLTRGFIAFHPILGVVPLANAIRPVGAWLCARSEWIPFDQSVCSFMTRNGSNLISPGMESVKRMKSGENANPHAISPDPARIESPPIDFNSTTFRSAPSALWCGGVYLDPGFHCISPRANTVRPGRGLVACTIETDSPSS